MHEKRKRFVHFEQSPMRFPEKVDDSFHFFFAEIKALVHHFSSSLVKFFFLSPQLTLPHYSLRFVNHFLFEFFFLVDGAFRILECPLENLARHFTAAAVVSEALRQTLAANAAPASKVVDLTACRVHLRNLAQEFTKPRFLRSVVDQIEE